MVKLKLQALLICSLGWELIYFALRVHLGPQTPHLMLEAILDFTITSFHSQLS